MTRMFSGGALVIATHNRGKLAEIAALMKDPALRLSCAANHGLDAPLETGTTFLENAVLKARFVADKTGLPALADDSGLCVEGLNGAPGVYSADWAETPQGRDFRVAMRRVLDELGNNPNRSARFVSVMALAWPDGHVETVEGAVTGVMATREHGQGGHGYDPVFLPDGHAKTFGEMTLEEKNAISHRARALNAMIEKCFR